MSFNAKGLSGRMTRKNILRAVRVLSTKAGRSAAVAAGFKLDGVKWVVRVGGKSFPSKTVAGIAAGFDASSFSGGVARLGRAFARAGFKVVDIAKVVLRVALVACSSLKADTAMVAEDLYLGTFFRKSRAFAEKTFDRWVILSAKHGVVNPSDVVAPYNEALTTAGKVARAEWASTVAESLSDLGDVEFTAFAGQSYIEPLREAGVEVADPLAGLGLGYKMQWLSNALTSN